jgi:hypothetical protein
MNATQPTTQNTTPRKKVLMEISGRYTQVRLIAKVQDPPVLHWRDSQKKDEPMEVFNPKMDEYGTRIYEIPLCYAERLMNGEPYKYQLVYPGKITMMIDTPNGGKEAKVFEAVSPYLKAGEIQRDEFGLPKWMPKDELPLDADDVK